jgi:WXG100 family type VII secretion target
VVSVVKVTFEDLQSTAQSLSTGAGHINDELNQLKAKVEALIGNGWEGAASTSFHDLYTKWQSGATQVHDALDGISQMLGAAAKTYQETETQLASQMRG